jgi:hypothetical protein
MDYPAGTAALDASNGMKGINIAEP